MPEISLHDDSAGWTDVILPDGALKSGMLKGLIGFQELNTTVKEKPQGTKGFYQYNFFPSNSTNFISSIKIVIFNKNLSKVVAKKSKKKAKKRKAQILFDKDEVVTTVHGQQQGDKPVTVQAKPKK